MRFKNLITREKKKKSEILLVIDLEERHKVSWDF